MTNRLNRLMIVAFAFLCAAAMVSAVVWVAKSLRTDVILLNADGSRRQLRDWFDGASLGVSSVIAGYHRTGFPADPAFFYRFTLTPGDIATMTAALDLKAQPNEAPACEVEPRYDEIASWWVLSSPDRVRCFTGEKDGRSFLLLVDDQAAEALFHVQNG